MITTINGFALLCAYTIITMLYINADWQWMLPEMLAVYSTHTPRRMGSFQYDKYIPASTEKYILENSAGLDYGVEGNVAVCKIWKNTSATPIHADLHAYMNELDDYKHRLSNFSAVKDLRLRFDEEDVDDVCQSLELHENGLKGIFRSGQLSFSSSGYIEPLLPPLRHPQFCSKRRKHLLDLGYLVHDFGAMCRKLKPKSRIILVDMGASLDFRASKSSPAIYLIELFRKFGFPFDHIYAFEVTPTPPEKVFSKVPTHLLASYHWINVGVSSDPKSEMNPLKLLLDNYNEDDLIVVKLDIDTSAIEVPLAMQLLNDDRYNNLIDHFYFEHHVHNKELAPYWRKSMVGTVQESLDLFAGLRRIGIPAHSWV
jgi:hypothetical protein